MRKLVEAAIVVLVGCAGCGEVDAASNPPGPATAGPEGSLTEQRSMLLAKNDGGGGVRCPRETPAAVNPPVDATLKASYPARGVQIYVCSAPVAGGAPAWTLKAPHAVLFQSGEAAVIHFAGPSWQALDGSLVTGVKTGSAPGPDATAIPWLLLQATSNGAPGVLADVTWIQRLATVGGVAPATGCDVGHLNAQVLVPYRADYFFYHTATDGKRVQQCAGK